MKKNITKLLVRSRQGVKLPKEEAANNTWAGQLVVCTTVSWMGSNLPLQLLRCNFTHTKIRFLLLP